jgi:hypothetical protein
MREAEEMNRRRFLSSLGMAAGVWLLAGCDGSDSPSAGGRLRIVHASPDTPNVDIVLDGTVARTNLSYQDFTGYQALATGTHSVQINRSGSSPTQTLITVNVPILPVTDVTLMILGRQANATTRAQLFTDNNTDPFGAARLRVIQAAPSASPTLDLYVTNPGVDLNPLNPMTTLNFGAATGFAQTAPGVTQARLTLSGTKAVQVDSGALTLGAGQVRTAVALDSPGGGPPFSMLILPDRG